MINPKRGHDYLLGICHDGCAIMANLKRQGNHVVQLDEAQQEVVALEEAMASVPRMVARGVTSRHIPPTAMIMAGLALMESTMGRKTIGVWLRTLSDKYLGS